MAANFADIWEQTPVDTMAGLQGDFANRVKAANDAWQAKTGKPLPINSAYRTPEEGVKLCQIDGFFCSDQPRITQFQVARSQFK